MKKIYLFLIAVFFYQINIAQDFTFEDGVSIETCSGIFYDNGGPDNNLQTTPGEQSFTICPDGDDLRIILDFTLFYVDNSNGNYFEIYDGADPENDPLIGSYIVGGAQTNIPEEIIASDFNESGCLTIVMDINSALPMFNPGFEAEISCQEPCQIIESEIISAEPAELVDGTFIIGFNEEITFVGGGNFSNNNDEDATYFWDFGDGNNATGQTVSHSYLELGTHIVSLEIVDADGCESFNEETIEILVEIDQSSGETGCPEIDVEEINIEEGDVTFGCDINEEITLTANFFDTGDTSQYTVTQIPYNPPFNYEGLSNPISVNTDDVWSPLFNLPFLFSFYGNVEDVVSVGSNGIISFQGPSGFNGFSIGPNDFIPNSTNNTIAQGNIMMTHDMDPSVNNADTEVAWEVLGEEPCRTLVVSFKDVAQFQCTTQKTTFMMVLYETTNAIDFYIQEKPVCSTWNGGRAALGIQNNAGNDGLSPPGRNTGDWAVSVPEAWRFTPSGPSIVEVEWFDEDNNFLGAGSQLNTTPLELGFDPVEFDEQEKIVIARASYDVFGTGEDMVIVEDSVTVGFQPQYEVEGYEIEECVLDGAILSPDIEFINPDLTESDLTYEWYLDGNLLEEFEGLSEITVFETGIYTVDVISESCTINTEFDVEILELPEVDEVESISLSAEDLDDIEFDLTIYSYDFFGLDQNTYQISYHFSEIEAENGENQIPNPESFTPDNENQVVFIRVELIGFESCNTVISFEIDVLIFSIGNPEDLVVCTQPGELESTFNLTENNTNVIFNNNSNDFFVEYFDSEDNALSNQNPIVNPESFESNENPQTIWVNLVNIDNPEFFQTASFELISALTPSLNNVDNIQLCGDFTFTQEFDLTLQDDTILQGNDTNLFNVAYFTSIENAENNLNPITSLTPNQSESQVFYAIQNSENPECSLISSFNLILLNVEIGTNPLPTVVECETNPEGEENPFDLTQQNEFVLGPNQQMQDYSISYFEDIADANGGSNPIAEPSQYNGNEEIIFVRIQHNENPECFEVGQFDLDKIENIDFTGIEDLNQCGDFSYSQGFNLISNTLNIFDFNIEEDIENISYFTTEQDAINGVNAINNLVQYSLPNGIDQQTIYVRVRKTEEFNSCLSFSSFELRLFNVEIANPLPNLVECITDGSETFTFDLTQQNGLILGSNQEAVDYTIAYFTSEADANNGINPIQNPEAYEAEEETIWVRIDNPTALDFDEECFEIDQFTVEAVQPATVNLDLDPLEECDTNNDNFSSEFDLDALIPIINFLDLDVEISFHLTEEDAASGNSPLSSPFQNVTDDTQTIWIRVEDENSGCTQFTTVELITYDTPQTQEVSTLEECAISDSNFAQVFDITQAEGELLMNVTDTENITIEYYINEDSAINQTAANQINNPDAYLSQTNQDNLEQTVYVRVTNSESPIDCFSVEAITLRVNPLPDFTPPTLLAVCKDDTSGVSGQFASFDLTSKIPEITNNNSNLAVNFFLNENEFEAGNPIENPEDYTNTVNPQSIFVAIESAQTGCSTTTNLTLVVSPNPTIPEPEPLVECDPGDNGFAQFDLAAAVDDILANEVEAEISFHETPQQAQNNTNPIAFEDGEGNSILFSNEDPFLQTIYVRASTTGNSNQLGTNCFVVRALDLIVEPSPSIVDLEDLVSCDDSTPNGFTSFDLTVNEALIIGEQDASALSVTYHLTQTSAEEGVQQIAVPQNFTNFTNPQEIFVRVESDDLGCSNATNSFTISVEPRPEIVPTVSYEYVCADPNDAQAQNNEIATFDLTDKDEEINPAFGDANTEVRYYASQEDFEAGIFIENPSQFQNTENPQLIFAEVVNIDNQCPSFTAVEFEFHVHPLPLADIGNMNGAAICVDPITGELTDPDNLPILDTQLDSNDYEFVWFLDGEELTEETDSFLIAFVPGLYEVEIIDIAFSLRTECFRFSQAEIIESSGPLFDVNVISQPFDGNHTIEITNIQGNGDYEFSVDGGPWIPQNNQEQIIVSGLEIGEVSVIGRDRNGCGEEVQDVTLIDYPKFFTPNNDGFNDSWNVVGLENQPESNVYIFDRYGKLLKQIKPSGEGWDGTYNGKPMPSNDYWFKVEYTAPRTGAKKTFKSNFTLKR